MTSKRTIFGYGYEYHKNSLKIKYRQREVPRIDRFMKICINHLQPSIIHPVKLR